MTFNYLLSRIYMLMGLLVFGVGVFTVFVPSVMTIYGFTTEEASTRTAVRSIIGGGEIAIGIGLLFGRRVGVSSAVLNGFTGLIFLSVGTTRLLSAAFEGMLTFASQPLREGLIEMGLAFFSIAASALSKSEA